MKAIRQHSVLIGIICSFEAFVSRTAIFISILGYVLLGNYITAEKIFAITAVYNCVRPVITILFSISITSIAEVNISIRRLQKILALEEKDDYTFEEKQQIQIDIFDKGMYDIINVNLMIQRLQCFFSVLYSVHNHNIFCTKILVVGNHLGFIPNNSFLG